MFKNPAKVNGEKFSLHARDAEWAKQQHHRCWGKYVEMCFTNVRMVYKQNNIHMQIYHGVCVCVFVETVLKHTHTHTLQV